MLIANRFGLMTEMRRGTWSGLDGRVVLRRDRKPREAEPAERAGDAKEEGAVEPAAPATIAIDPSGD